MTEEFNLDDYDYELPEELIAQEPPARRGASRLLIVRHNSPLVHARFEDLAGELLPGDLLVLNQTRVIPARLYGTREKTGGRVEILLLAPRRTDWDILLKTRGKPEPGEELLFASGALRMKLVEKGDRGRWRATLHAKDGLDPLSVVDEIGTMPLPPYIKRNKPSPEQTARDRERYQTVFAREAGAVAAPTAGLHFSEAFLQSLHGQGIETARVTLHVGLGTFQPIEAKDFRRHEMHAEYFVVDQQCADAVNAARKRGRRVVAVGTTSLRSLESAWDAQRGEVRPKEGQTRLFIYPPREIQSADALVTNFHLPRSSLMLLVSAFAGRDTIMNAYQAAIAERYRFFSYGDAMFLERLRKES